MKTGTRVEFLSKKDVKVYGKFGTIKDAFRTSTQMYGVIPDSMPGVTVDTAGKRLRQVKK